MATETPSQRGEIFLQNLKNTPLNIRNLNIRGNGIPGDIDISFLRNGELITASGQYFVDLPEAIANELPGSYISQDTFFRQLSINDSDNEKKRRLLGRDNEGKRVLVFDEGGQFRLNVFSGTTNQNALKIMEIAAREKAFDDPINRVAYQQNLWKIVKPVLKYETKTSPSIHIIEDCLASGDTIMGVLTALNQRSKINELDNVRIDVAVATAQGILLLKKFTKDNGFKLELNVGYMAFGLSKGIKSDKGQGLEHANYITHPPELLAEVDKFCGPGIAYGIKYNEDIFVVGDMGDAGKSVSRMFDNKIPWNVFRKDRHGEREDSKQMNDPAIKEENYPTIIYLANGGYLMRALYNYLLYVTGKREPLSELVFDAKRRFDEIRGKYGVLLSNLDVKHINGPSLTLVTSSATFLPKE